MRCYVPIKASQFFYSHSLQISQKIINDGKYYTPWYHGIHVQRARIHLFLFLLDAHKQYTTAITTTITISSTSPPAAAPATNGMDTSVATRPSVAIAHWRGEVNVSTPTLQFASIISLLPCTEMDGWAPRTHDLMSLIRSSQSESVLPRSLAR